MTTKIISNISFKMTIFYFISPFRDCQRICALYVHYVCYTLHVKYIPATQVKYMPQVKYMTKVRSLSNPIYAC